MHDRQGTRIRRVVSHMLLGAAVALGTALAAVAARAADPTAQELHYLYEVNRARHDPPAWAAEYGLGSQTGGDGQPVAAVLRTEPIFGCPRRRIMARAVHLVEEVEFLGGRIGRADGHGRDGGAECDDGSQQNTTDDASNPNALAILHDACSRGPLLVDPWPRIVRGLHREAQNFSPSSRDSRHDPARWVWTSPAPG